MENKEIEFDADTVLPCFFRDLACKIENKTLSKRELLKAGEFYMEFLFNTQVNADNNFKEMSTRDFNKFLTMGWYVYNMLLNNKNI